MVSISFYCCPSSADAVRHPIPNVLLLPFPPRSSNPIAIAPRGGSHFTRATLWRYQRWVNKKQQMWKRRAKVCTVDGSVTRRLWRVDVFTTAAIELHRLFVRKVCEAYRK